MVRITFFAALAILVATGTVLAQEQRTPDEAAYVVGLWANARADHLLGENEKALTLYRMAGDRAQNSVKSSSDPRDRALFLAVASRAKAAIAELGGRGTQPTARRPGEIVADLAALKSAADRARIQNDSIAARLDYEAVSQGAKFLQTKFPGDPAGKSAAWLADRSEQALCEISKEVAASRPAGASPLARYREYMARHLAVRSLPSTVGELPFRNLIGEAEFATAKAYRNYAGTSGQNLLEVVRRAVSRFAAEGPDAEALVAFADGLTQEENQAASAPPTIEMGAPQWAHDRETATAALEIYLHVLAIFPDYERREDIARKVLLTCMEPGAINERAEMLSSRFGDGVPGLVGGILYKLDRARRLDKEATDVLGRLLQDPDRRLPPCSASREILEDAFQLCLSSAKTDEAGLTAEVMAQREPDLAPQLFLTLANKSLSILERDKAVIFLQRVLQDYPSAPEAMQAAALLRGVAEPARATEPLSEERLAAMADSAQANPWRYWELGAACRGVRQFDKAREAYLIYARRFDDYRAYLEAAVTYMEEGRAARGLEIVKGLVDRHVNDPATSPFVSRIRKPCIENGLGISWGELCLHMAEECDPQAVKPYLDGVADVMCKVQFAPTGKTAEYNRLVRAIKRSQHDEAIGQLIDQKMASTQGRLNAVLPSYIDVQGPSKLNLEARVRTVSPLPESAPPSRSPKDDSRVAEVQRRIDRLNSGSDSAKGIGLLDAIPSRKEPTWPALYSGVHTLGVVPPAPNESFLAPSLARPQAPEPDVVKGDIGSHLNGFLATGTTPIETPARGLGGGSDLGTWNLGALAGSGSDTGALSRLRGPADSVGSARGELSPALPGPVLGIDLPRLGSKGIGDNLKEGGFSSGQVRTVPSDSRPHLDRLEMQTPGPATLPEGRTGLGNLLVPLQPGKEVENKPRTARTALADLDGFLSAGTTPIETPVRSLGRSSALDTWSLGTLASPNSDKGVLSRSQGPADSVGSARGELSPALPGLERGFDLPRLGSEGIGDRLTEGGFSAGQVRPVPSESRPRLGQLEMQTPSPATLPEAYTGLGGSLAPLVPPQVTESKPHAHGTASTDLGPLRPDLKLPEQHDRGERAGAMQPLRPEAEAVLPGAGALSEARTGLGTSLVPLQPGKEMEDQPRAAGTASPGVNSLRPDLKLPERQGQGERPSTVEPLRPQAEAVLPGAGVLSEARTGLGSLLAPLTPSEATESRLRAPEKASTDVSRLRLDLKLPERRGQEERSSVVGPLRSQAQPVLPGAEGNRSGQVAPLVTDVRPVEKSPSRFSGEPGASVPPITLEEVRPADPRGSPGAPLSLLEVPGADSVAQIPAPRHGSLLEGLVGTAVRPARAESPMSAAASTVHEMLTFQAVPAVPGQTGLTRPANLTDALSFRNAGEIAAEPAIERARKAFNRIDRLSPDSGWTAGSAPAGAVRLPGLNLPGLRVSAVISDVKAACAKIEAAIKGSNDASGQDRPSKR